jgi:hypothetical protein|tara:strand:+ start:2591 stop:3226 length:636 start_codon:yes stop_codon:yes gene_type:complete
MTKKYYSLLKVEETDVENKPVTDNDADFHKKQILHKLVVRNASTSENNILLVTKADTSAGGPHMTLHRDSQSPANNDVLGKIQFKGNDSSGATIRYGSINAKIKDVRNGEDDSALEFVARKGGQHKAFVIMQSDGVFLFNDMPLVLKSADGKTTRIKGASTTKRNINFPDSNGEVMVNDSGKVMATDLPTSDPNNQGQLWNDNGTVKISAG